VFSRIFVGVDDFERALSFYRLFMSVLGVEQRFCDRHRSWAGWQSSPGPRPLSGVASNRPVGNCLAR